MSENKTSVDEVEACMAEKCNDELLAVLKEGLPLLTAIDAAQEARRLAEGIESGVRWALRYACQDDVDRSEGYEGTDWKEYAEIVAPRCDPAKFLALVTQAYVDEEIVVEDFAHLPAFVRGFRCGVGLCTGHTSRVNITVLDDGE